MPASRGGSDDVPSRFVVDVTPVRADVPGAQADFSDVPTSRSEFASLHVPNLRTDHTWICAKRAVTRDCRNGPMTEASVRTAAVVGSVGHGPTRTGRAVSWTPGVTRRATRPGGRRIRHRRDTSGTVYLEGRLTPHADVRTTIEVPEARCVVRSGEDSHCDHTGGTTQATKSGTIVHVVFAGNCLGSVI